MFRWLFVCALLLSFPLVGRADDKPEPTETVIKLIVQPAPAPKPALRYQLLPELREMSPGNAAQAYLLCFMQENNFFFHKDAVEHREKWEKMPLKELPLKELVAYGYGRGSRPLRQADYAARLDTVDWQVLLKLRREGVKLLLPELQELRILATALKVRFRVEVAEQRFDDALITAKTLFALARHLEDHSTMISGLVGIAIANVAVGPLEELLQQPGCPNLFWALIDLPKPLVSLRKGVQAERMFLENVFDAVDDKAPMSEAQLKTAVDRVRQLIRDINGLPWLKQDVGEWLVSRAKDETRVELARRRLIEFGLPEARVKQFPALQVVLLEERFVHYETWRDDGMKAMMLPFWQAEPLLINRTPPQSTKEESLFIGLTSGFRKVREAQARLEQRLALLCCVEALRLHAAEHGGKLPAQLADVKLPLPVDPMTGKPFAYQLDGETASLHGTPPKGLEKVATYNIRYAVTLRK